MNILKFLFAIFLSFLPGLLGIMVAPISAGNNEWYTSLTESVLTPAAWVFSGVWTILYFMIGIALYLIMRKQDSVKHSYTTNAYIWFTLNIVFNALWSFAFFGVHSPVYALVVLMGLIIIAIFMARAFCRISKSACWLTLPYVFWLMFAFYLNWVIVYLN
jgi:tryptophan-rich sensory protein